MFKYIICVLASMAIAAGSIYGIIYLCILLQLEAARVMIAILSVFIYSMVLDKILKTFKIEEKNKK